MVFSSLTFIFVFLPLVLIFYFLSKDKYKNYILLFFSILFYSWGEPKYALLMIISIIVNYFFAILIKKYDKYKKLFLILSLVFNIGILFVFKYFNFFSTNINNIFNINIPILNLTLPIGISFYTFQILTYVADVYNDKVKLQKNIFLLGMYISFFPQLIAGPIVRYSTIEEQLKNRKHTLEKFADGLRRFIIGLGKKIIIANNVAIIADSIFNNAILNKYVGLVLIIGALAYTFQIYFDFSGYSDMAIGLGKMFGFEFLENFNYPYISQNITDFWRRWHISLSSLFRDYVYIPLGGNRVSKFKWIRNILIVWLLTGLWHGANWNFIIWGLYFALILLFEKLIFHKILKKLPLIIRWLYSFILINIGWIIFRLEDFSELSYVFKNLFNFKSGSLLNLLRKNYSILNYFSFIILAFIFSFPLILKLDKRFKDNNYYFVIKDFCLIFVFVISICFLVSNSYNPFIYFRF